MGEKGFTYAGQESRPWDTLTVNGVKIGLTAFAPNTGCLRITDYEKVKEIVGELNASCDVVIVSFHGGAEGSSKTHITRKTEIFYGEDAGDSYRAEVRKHKLMTGPGRSGKSYLSLSLVKV